jgi:uncharacterized membrane protein YfcA
MHLSADQYLIIALALAAGAVLQSTVGFAFAILSTPILVWAGVPLPTTVAIGGAAVLVQTAMSCWRHRAELPWRDALTMFGPRLVGMPVGVYVLEHFVVGSPERVKQVVGVVVLLAVTLLFAFRPKPRPRLATRWTVAAGTVSGALNGLTGMGGPPIVLWLSAHDWSNVRARAFLWLSFLLIIPVQFATMSWRFPHQAPQGILIGLAMFPVVLAGSRLGLWLGDHLSRQRLRWAMLAVLAVMGVSSVLGPMLSSPAAAKTPTTQPATAVQSNRVDESAKSLR